MQDPESDCEGCKGEDLQACPLHGEIRVVGDAPVLSRARLSLPPLLALRETGDGQGNGRPGVFAGVPIQARTRFGPLTAPPCRNGLRASSSAEHLPDYDLTDEDKCNWMALVRPAICQEEQNLDSMVLLNKVYYISTKVIPKETELRVWYAPWFAQKCGLPLVPQTHEELQKSPDSTKGESCTVNTTENSLTVNVKEAKDLSLPKRSRRSTALLSQSSSETSSRRKKPQKHTYEKNTAVASIDGSIEKTLSPPSDAGELKSRAGRKLKPNWKYPTPDSDDSEMIHAPVSKKQRKKSSEPGRFQKLSPPVSQCGETSTPLKTALDVLISAMERNQSDIQCGQEESSRDSGKVGSQEPDGGSEAPRNTASRGSLRYSCRHCHVNFKAEEPWRKHEAQHTGEAPFTCEVQGCGKGFDTKFKFWRHQMTHRTPTNKKCPYCTKCFHRADHLKKHVQTHDAFRQLFTCERCGTEYKSKESYTYHMAVHKAQEDNSLLCSLCPMLVASREELVAHLKAVHNRYKSIVDAPKLYSCPTCGKSFTTKKDMHRHTLVHEKKRNFLCEYCSQSFVRKDHLQRHMHSNHRCEMSGAGGQTARLVCEQCHSGFHSEDQLTFHLSSVHSQVAMQEGKATAVQDSSTSETSSTQEMLVMGLKGDEAPELGDQDWTGMAGTGGQTVALTQPCSTWNSMPPPSTPLSTAVCLVVQSQSGSGNIAMPSQQQVTLHQGRSGPKQVLVQLQQIQQPAVPHHQHLQGLPLQHRPEQQQQQQHYLLQLHLQKSQQQQLQEGQQQQQPPPLLRQVPQQNLAPFSSECSCASQSLELHPLRSVQPGSASAAGCFQHEFTASSQPSENMRHRDNVFAIKPSSIHSVIANTQEKIELAPAVQSVPKSQLQLTTDPRATTVHAQDPCCGMPEVSCANMELPQKKGVCMLTTLGFHTTQLKTELCDSCPVMDAVSLAGGCQMASGSCCSLECDNPPASPASSMKSNSGSKEFPSIQDSLITTAQGPPTSADTTSPGSAFHCGSTQGDSDSFNAGDWTGQATTVRVFSSQNQNIPVFTQEAPASGGMSSKLFPQAFPVRTPKSLPLNHLVSDMLATSGQKGLTYDSLSIHQPCEGVHEATVPYTDKSGGVPLSEKAGCLPSSDLAFEDANVAFHTSVPAEVISSSFKSATAHIGSSPLQTGGDNCAAGGAEESSSVQPSESVTPTQDLAVPVSDISDSHVPGPLNSRQPLLELSSSQQSSDHCYATLDGGAKQPADSPLC